MIEKLITRLEKERVVLISRDELEGLLAAVRVVEEKDTRLSDWIRILDAGGRILIQETTDKNEIAVRLSESLEEARRFVEERMETYDRMWDGCGCRIDYLYKK